MRSVEDIYREGYASNIVDALSHIREMGEYTTPSIIRLCLEGARRHLRNALGWANHLKDASLRSLCMKLLGWISADLRRLPA